MEAGCCAIRQLMLGQYRDANCHGVGPNNPSYLSSSLQMFEFITPLLFLAPLTVPQFHNLPTPAAQAAVVSYGTQPELFNCSLQVMLIATTRSLHSSSS